MKKGVVYDPHLKMLLADAAHAFRKRDDNTLRKLLREAASRSPHRLDIWFDLANHHIQTGNPEPAIAIFRDLSRIVPRDVDVLFTLAHWLQYSGDVRGAEAVRWRLEASCPEASRDYEHLQAIIMKWLAHDVNTEIPEPDGGLDHLAIVVLGYKLEPDGSMHSDLVERLEKALEAAKRHPNALVVVSGGVPRSGRVEAVEMRQWLVERGVNRNRIYEEGYSRDVVENLVYSRQILDMAASERVLVVTAAENLRRAGACMDVLAWKKGSAFKTEVAAAAGMSSSRFVDDGRDRLKLFRDSLRAYGMPMMRTYPELVEL
jgi:tetratricopeptide (TPR) repeat protein